MNISFINIKNFRKLTDVKIDFSDDTTLFVGANNSGKTSAMDALRKFLVNGDRNNFIYNDFTVTVRRLINNIGNNWVISEVERPSELSDWLDIVPTMDLWLEVENNEFHYVSNIIPTLDWTGGKLGIRLSFSPKDVDKLFDDYREAFFQSRNTEKSDKNTDSIKLYPQDLCEFIERHLIQYFEIKTFILDPAKIDEVQDTDFDCECEEKNPMNGLVKIDMIYAQRGLSDADSSNNGISLSQQLRTYYDKHLDIEKKTSPEDLETLSALKKAHETFDTTLAIKFKDPFSELEKLGFPGITDPKITIESKFKEKTAFEHDSAVQYALKDDDTSLRLPEKYNGLGYQNLISITFKLMSFRDDRIHKGKAASEENSEKIAPLHLVLLEEPEAHLHVQVQQVLIKKAYEILTDSNVLRDNNFNTQLVVSTHSSHIAKEVPFKNTRYFKRVPITDQTTISTAEIVNLTDTFGADEKTEKFVQRYLRIAHCDLFFADAVIFVEGTSETVLVPYFIKNDYLELDGRYITVLPVGGSHSHRFKPLIEKLGISTLIITDLDPCDSDANRSSVPPKRGQPKNIISSNPSLVDWGITDTTLESLLNLQGTNKEFENNSIKVAFQTPVNISLNGMGGEVLAATFEDSLIYANLTVLQSLTGSGLISKIKSAAQKTTISDFRSDIYKAVHEASSNSKVSFVLDLIYGLDKVEAPRYIQEGLEWLQGKLHRIEVEIATGGTENA